MFGPARNSIMIFGVALGAGGLTVPASGGGGCPLPECTLDFDTQCPNAGELCGATFIGGTGCVIDFLPFCYNTGQFSYRVDPGFDLEIQLSGDLLELEVFFANVAGSSGTMTFFNELDEAIGVPMTTNGDCAIGMPPLQDRSFSEGVRRIEVTATGGRVYIDSFHINAGVTPPVGDLDGDCTVGAADLAQLLGAWGPNPGHPADLDGSGTVDAADLAMLLGNWGV